MSTPQRSRYPRPLKATHTYSGGNGPGQSPLGAPSLFLALSTSTSNGQTVEPAASTTNQGCPAALKSGYSSPPPGTGGGGGGGGRRAGYSPPLEMRGSPVASRGERVGVSNQEECCDGLDSRLSNSLGSLSDPDYYMNSVWPRVITNAIQSDGEDPLTYYADTEFSFSHKRSNSCSGTDRLKVNKQGTGLRGGAIPPAHTSTSIEGLNQEVSSVLEGNPILLIQTTHPDGHVAPIRDLISSNSVGTQTPPLAPGVGTSNPVHHAPFPLALSPSSSSHTVTSETTPTTAETTPTTAEAIQSGINTFSLDSHTSSGDNHTSSQHPSSPKPSFAREPPDGAERCILKVETSIYGDGYIPRGPDKSKGNITFKGTAFAPPLPATPSLNLQSVV